MQSRHYSTGVTIIPETIPQILLPIQTGLFTGAALEIWNNESLSIV
jgi:hypothetical protein